MEIRAIQEQKKGGIKMNVALPIKDKKKIKELLGVYEFGSKNHLLIAFCIYTGLRISDVLQTRVGSAQEGIWEGKEQKTGKHKRIKLNTTLQALIQFYLMHQEEPLNDDDYLFYSSRDRSTHIKRNRADKIIRHGGDMIGLKLSAHSLRKTFGWLAYQNGTDITLLMEVFNHSTQATTLRYIGITQDDIENVYQNIDIGI